MGDSRLTALVMENHHQPSTILSMDFDVSHPPDINLPLDSCDVLFADNMLALVPTKVVARKCGKRVDTIWGAWFFYTHYFKPALNDKSELNHDVFMVQHDMENMYMWAFKERPENALGKMQLRSYMNGHSRQGERPFPFSADKGFVRSHRMQRKHYRGLSNPQCVHGVELVPSPNLSGFADEDRLRWAELTGRDWSFTVPPEASDFGSWRNLPSTDFELERLSSKKIPNGSGLNLCYHSSGSEGTELSPESAKRRKDECYLAFNQINSPPAADQTGPSWANDFSGVMKNVFGPVTAAKTIYEDEDSYLIIISLPCVDLQRVKVSWRNTLTHGIIKVSGVSTARMPFIKRRDKVFRLADPSSEHCPPGEFVREIPLSTRIVEDANIEAYYDGPGSVLEIVVPKLRSEAEEHEIRVCFRSTGKNDLTLT